MSCQINVVANILDIDNIRKCLFPMDKELGSDGWLDQCLISVCPVGDLIVIAREKRLVILVSKWDPVTESSQFQITFSGVAHEVDNIKAVLCLPLVTQRGGSHISHDWTCIVLGFDSGFIRCYMETCDLLFEEQFHNECISNLKCQSQHNTRPDISLKLNSEEIYIQYQSNVCVIPGNQLFPLLRNCRNQLARVQANSELVDISTPNFNIMKWGFQDQSVINDIAVIGLTISGSFNHLLSTSIFGGFDSKPRSMPPNSNLVLGAGSKPYLGFHYAIEGGNQPVLSDVAKAVAYKLKSALPNWLVGNSSQSEKRPSISLQSSDMMSCKFGLCDLHRKANAIIVSHSHKLVAVSDSLGRVIIIDTEKGVALKILKGYRDAQCSFIQVSNEKKSKYKIAALFLVIYSPKKGTIEIFTTQQFNKITTFSASKYSRLLYINYSLMGFTYNTKSKYVCQFTTLLIDNDGKMKEINIPFHFAVGEENNKKARDIHLYRKLKQLIKCENYDEDTLLKEAMNTTKELQTFEIKSQLINMLLTCKNLPMNVLLQCVQYIADNFNEEQENETVNLFKIKISNIISILNFYLFVQNINECEDITENMEPTILKIEEKETYNIQRLLDLNTEIRNREKEDLQVTFSENDTFSITDFLSIFNLNEESNITLLSNIDDHLFYKVSETLFHDHVKKCKNYKCFQEQVLKSKIAIKDLFILLITYWVQRPLNADVNIESDMVNLSSIFYLLLRTTKDPNFEGNLDEDFWSEIRDYLANSNKTLSALTAAIICKYVAHKIEREKDLERLTNVFDDENMEILSEENVEWALLIGKLEDISLINIILESKLKLSKHSKLPKLKHEKINLSLKYIIEKKGSVSELVAQWLTLIGIDPELIVLNDKINFKEENSEPIEINAEITNFIQSELVFQYLNMMRKQWPFSLEAGIILTNMSWEYALEWKKDIQNMNYLEACIMCLKHIPNLHVKVGLSNLIWKTHLKLLFENSIKLLNKLGKVPKERLCQQDTGLSNLQLPIFIKISTYFLDVFTDLVKLMYTTSSSSPILKFESVWDNGGRCLPELALQQIDINYLLLLSHYQLSLVFHMLCTFSVRSVKPINNLFDSEVVNILFSDFHVKTEIDYDRTDSKLKNARLQFLTRIITSSIEAITSKGDEVYLTDHVDWMAKCVLLGGIWLLDIDILRRHQIMQLFTHGYNVFAYDINSMVNDRKQFGIELLALAGKRMALRVAASKNLGTYLSELTPRVTMYMETLDKEWCAGSTLKELIDLTTLSLSNLDEDQLEYKVGMTLLDACYSLQRSGEI